MISMIYHKNLPKPLVFISFPALAGNNDFKTLQFSVTIIEIHKIKKYKTMFSENDFSLFPLMQEPENQFPLIILENIGNLLKFTKLLKIHEIFAIL